MSKADQPVDAYVALGSNLGDRAAHLRAAREALGRLPGTRLEAMSPVYETPPVGPAGQGSYFNAVARLATTLAPGALLTSLLSIEHDAGRVRRERWGPRTLDLDLLIYGEAAVRAGGLTVPHPRMHERAFVLRPLCDLAPDLVHPLLGRTVSDLLGALGFEPMRRVEIDPR